MYEIRLRYKQVSFTEYRETMCEAMEYACEIMRNHKYSKAEIFDKEGVQLTKVVKERTGKDDSFAELFRGC